MDHTNSDYLYRAVLPRDAVKQAVAAMIDQIDYPNFKDSVEDMQWQDYNIRRQTPNGRPMRGQLYPRETHGSA
jgi:hypothetical protein